MSDTTALRSPTLEAPGMWRRSGLLIGLVAALLSAVERHLVRGAKPGRR